MLQSVGSFGSSTHESKTVVVSARAMHFVSRRCGCPDLDARVVFRNRLDNLDSDLVNLQRRKSKTMASSVNEKTHPAHARLVCGIFSRQ